MEPITALAAVAARTQRVRLGTAVLLAALRHPVLLSHAVGTLDLIAGGRTVLAIGVGGAFNAEQQAEWAAAGVGTAGRASRLEELVRITKGLTAGEEVNHEGRHFQLDSVRMEPSANQPGGCAPAPGLPLGGLGVSGNSSGLPSWPTVSYRSPTPPKSSPSSPIRCATTPESIAGTSTRWSPPST